MYSAYLQRSSSFQTCKNERHKTIEKRAIVRDQKVENRLQEYRGLVERKQHVFLGYSVL